MFTEPEAATTAPRKMITESEANDYLREARPSDAHDRIPNTTPIAARICKREI